MSAEEEYLSTLGGTIRDLFNSLLATNALREQDPGLFLDIRNAAERFELWAINLGLYQRGHSSLDYRFRDASSVNDFAFNVLRTLQSSLVRLNGHFSTLAASSGTDAGQASEGNSSDEFSDDSDLDELNQLPWQQAELTSVNTSVDRLYRLASKIQDPRSRTDSSKAKAYTEINPETNIDLMAMYAVYDEHYIREHVTQLRRNGDSPCPEYLILRLARANTLRRKHFKRWKRHNMKMKMKITYKAVQDVTLHMTTPAGVVLNDINNGPPALSALTPATDLPMHKIDINDEASTVASTNFERQEKKDAAILPIPGLPSSLRDQARFECPYCYILCSKKLGRGTHWRNHVMHDLKPYVCTDRDCQWGEQLFDSISQWKSHEVSHCHQESAADSFQKRCDICGEMSVDLDHLAAHLEHLSIFALPHSTGFETESTYSGSLGSLNIAREARTLKSLSLISSIHGSNLSSAVESDSLTQPSSRPQVTASNLDLKAEEAAQGHLSDKMLQPDGSIDLGDVQEWMDSVSGQDMPPTPTGSLGGPAAIPTLTNEEAGNLVPSPVESKAKTSAQTTENPRTSTLVGWPQISELRIKLRRELDKMEEEDETLMDHQKLKQLRRELDEIEEEYKALMDQQFIEVFEFPFNEMVEELKAPNDQTDPERLKRILKSLGKRRDAILDRLERFERELDEMKEEGEALKDHQRLEITSDTQSENSPDEDKPIRFKDAVGRKFAFPFHLCKTWKGMESLVKQAFLHTNVLSQHVADGHYDLIGPNNEIILPTVWESVIEPDWPITMIMWPLPGPEPEPKEELPININLSSVNGIFDDPLLWQKLAASPKTRDFIADPAFATSLNRLKEQPNSVDVDDPLGKDPRILQALHVLLEYHIKQSSEPLTSGASDIPSAAAPAKEGSTPNLGETNRSFFSQ